MSSCDPVAVLGTLKDVLRWSRERGFRGHSKHDALNSPVLSALTFGNRILRLLAIQSVMRFPFNVRPLLAVPRRRNPKGIGLFAHACLDLADYLDSVDTLPREEGAAPCAGEASTLLEWLVGNASPQARPSKDLLESFPGHGETGPSPTPAGSDLRGLGWGYHYPWQDVGFFQPAHFPNRVVSSWIGFAFLRAFERSGERRFLLASQEIATFLLGNPKKLADTPEQLCLSYVPLKEVDWAVMDVSALVSAFCAQLSGLGGVVEGFSLEEEARRLMRFVVDKQTDYGAWYYTWPAGESHIRHDNYHTGIILDCLADYMTASGDRTWEQNYREGLEFYRRHLFLENGAPRWMNDQTFPHDIHGAAAGILAFSRAARYGCEILGDTGGAAENLAFACRILRWTLANLHSREGFFFYQKARWVTKRFCLMRWCNAWMSRALASLLLTAARTGLPLSDAPVPSRR